MSTPTSYDIIKDKIVAMKKAYPKLSSKPDEYVFSALCIRANYYKNPSLNFSEQTVLDAIVDSQFDGGVDAMILDPNTEESNLVLIQSKFYQNITADDVKDAIQKLILFYKDMLKGEYHQVNQTVSSRFIDLNADTTEDSKVRFVLYTSAKRNNLKFKTIEKIVKDSFQDTEKFELSLLFADDIVEEIKELESRRPSIEIGKIAIDEKDNYLLYGDNAAIVNVSAFSLKELYAQHSTNLLSRNLRYYIRKKDIDKSINETINENPDYFWYRNNGVTILCDEFRIDGKVVHLKEFSVVNGGQTTHLIYKNKDITKENDIFLPCKIIQTIGETMDEKNNFILDIARAANSQKPIKEIDLKANAPEQVRFSVEMRNCDIFYQTKRGENIPKEFKEDFQNTDLAQVGKLCLAGVFQVPAASRSKPSSMYLEKFYTPVFDSKNPKQIAQIVKELLYIDSYWKRYLKEYDKKHASDPSNSIPFAHNARTLCIAFVALAARYKCGNITNEKLKSFFAHFSENMAYDNYLYAIFSDLNNVDHLLPNYMFVNKDAYEAAISKLFDIIISAGRTYYKISKGSDAAINETNFLKNDLNYYKILEAYWDDLSEQINTLFDSF